jgi:hypothetical protein
MRQLTYRLAPIALILWGLATLTAVAQGLLYSAPLPPPAFVPIVTLLMVVLIVVFPGFRDRVMAVDIRTLVALHLVRFVGAYFLWLNTQGRLPTSFALPAGVGDLIVAVGAVALLLSGRAKSGGALLIWNIVGFIDIMMVVANAFRVVLTDPAGFAEFRHLPLGLLPTFIVPLIIVSHILLFERLRRQTA